MERLVFFDRIPAMPQPERQKIQWAYSLASKYLEGKKRDNGDSYFDHACGTANILIDHGYCDAEHIILGMCHDLPEDTDIPISMMEGMFGPELAREMLAVSKTIGLEHPLTGQIFRTPKLTKEEYFAMVRRNGIRAMRAKCGDRIYNLEDLVNDQPKGSRWTPEKRLIQVQETREWIIPLARDADPRFEVRLIQQCALIEANVRVLQQAMKKRRVRRAA